MAGNRIMGVMRCLSRQNAFSLKGYTLQRSMASAQSEYTSASGNFQYNVKDGVAVITIDKPNSPVNTLDPATTDECVHIMNKLKEDDRVNSAVLISGKPSCFIAGADINMLAAAPDLETVSKLGQQTMQALEDSKKPVVAAIMGTCLGGGLETALACHYRIAVKNKKTTLAVPEVMLGLLPGAGGTQRLLKLLSVPNALDMMLTGKNIRADKAKKMGLVDAVVDSLGPGIKSADQNTRDYLEQVAIQTAKGLANGTIKKTGRKKGLTDKIMDKVLSYEFGQNYVLNQATKSVMKMTNGLYPAPLQIIDVVRTTLKQGGEAGLKAESSGFGKLGPTSESKALIGLFHGQTHCKKNHFSTPEKPPKNLAVLGAGLMGAGIAEVSLDKGYHTILKDMSSAGLARGVKQVENGYKKAVKKRKMTSFEKDTILSNLSGQLDYTGFDKVDMVIEAVFEDIDLKHKIVKEVEKHISPDCIFASNTSALPISKIAEASARPEKVIGMHYFSPVDKMQLLEIITTDKTSKDTIAAAVDVGLKQGKTIIVVKDGPGFYTTRAISALIQAGAPIILESGDPSAFNKQTRKMGFPIGLATLIDEVGLDVGMKIQKYLAGEFGARMTPTDSMAQFFSVLVNEQSYGRKSNKGIFLYEDGAKGERPVNPTLSAFLTEHKTTPLVEPSFENNRLRLLGAFANEAVMCLEEGILPDPASGDIGLVFGTGFPAQLGGPFQWIDHYGADKLVAKMDEFAAAYGPAMEPCQLLRDHAKDTSKKFHKA